MLSNKICHPYAYFSQTFLHWYLILYHLLYWEGSKVVLSRSGPPYFSFTSIKLLIGGDLWHITPSRWSTELFIRMYHIPSSCCLIYIQNIVTGWIFLQLNQAYNWLDDVISTSYYVLWYYALCCYHCQWVHLYGLSYNIIINIKISNNWIKIFK